VPRCTGGPPSDSLNATTRMNAYADALVPGRPPAKPDITRFFRVRTADPLTGWCLGLEKGTADLAQARPPAPIPMNSPCPARSCRRTLLPRQISAHQRRPHQLPRIALQAAGKGGGGRGATGGAFS
jgi:hypothetical protein